MNERRAWAAAVFGLVALIASSGCGRRPSDASSSASSAAASKPGAELKVVMGRSAKVEADTSVRCFANGQFVGMQTAAACAQKNGVAPGALDVGLDQSGAIAAGGGDTRLQPLANAGGDDGDGGQSDAAPPADADGDARAYADMAPADCKAYAPGGWRGVGRAVGLDACVHALFDGRCPTPGQTAYGHWGPLSLRAVPGRIEVSRDNRRFTPLAPQYPADCSIPPV